MKHWWIVRASRDQKNKEVPERSFLTEEDAKLALSTYRVVYTEFKDGETFVEFGLGMTEKEMEEAVTSGAFDEDDDEKDEDEKKPDEWN